MNCNEPKIATTFDCPHCSERMTLLSQTALMWGQCWRCDKIIPAAFWTITPTAFLTLDPDHLLKKLRREVPETFALKNNKLTVTANPPTPQESQKFRPPQPGRQAKKNTAFLRSREGKPKHKKGDK